MPTPDDSPEADNGLKNSLAETRRALSHTAGLLAADLKSRAHHTGQVAKERLGPTASTAKEKFSQTAETAKEKLNETATTGSQTARRIPKSAWIAVSGAVVAGTGWLALRLRRRRSSSKASDDE